jgi:hypothetical protein
MMIQVLHFLVIAAPLGLWVVNGTVLQEADKPIISSQSITAPPAQCGRTTPQSHKFPSFVPVLQALLQFLELGHQCHHL